ncbi:hypothetical protein D3C71_1429750 [compost metagenome]
MEYLTLTLLRLLQQAALLEECLEELDQVLQLQILLELLEEQHLLQVQRQLRVMDKIHSDSLELVTLMLLKGNLQMREDLQKDQQRHQQVQGQALLRLDQVPRLVHQEKVRYFRIF